MNRIITISREYGAAGGTVGRAVAKKLGYEYYDKAIILRTAREYNLDVESMTKWDEKVQTNFGFAQSLFDAFSRPTSDRLFEAQKDIIRKIAEKGKCVIVGRNANIILKEFEHALHVFINADENWRVDWMKKKEPEKSETKIREELKAVDKERRKHCAYYTDTEFGMSDYYDVCLRVSTLGVDQCVDTICANLFPRFFFIS